MNAIGGGGAGGGGGTTASVNFVYEYVHYFKETGAQEKWNKINSYSVCAISTHWNNKKKAKSTRGDQPQHQRSAATPDMAFVLYFIFFFFV